MSAARHERFYWELVTFQVDNTLYKVPKQQFVTGSSFFRDLFQLPQGDGVVEGRDDEHPIHLPGDVTKDEFEILIRAVCSSAFGEDLGQFSKDDWMCCLKLSTMWEFKALRQTSIDRLSNKVTPVVSPAQGLPGATPAERVALGMQYRVPAWIQDGVVELATQDSLILKQGEKTLLGSDAALSILEIREDVRGLRDRTPQITTTHNCPSCGYYVAQSTTNAPRNIAAENSLVEAAIKQKFSTANE